MIFYTKTSGFAADAAAPLRYCYVALSEGFYIPRTNARLTSKLVLPNSSFVLSQTPICRSNLWDTCGEIHVYPQYFAIIRVINTIFDKPAHIREVTI